MEGHSFQTEIFDDLDEAGFCRHLGSRQITGDETQQSLYEGQSHCSAFTSLPIP